MRAGARGPAAGRAARRRGLRAEGPLAAGRGRGLGQHDVPALRRPRPARDRHDGHVRRLVLVLPALLRRRQRRGRVGPRGAPPLDARRPVHRRRRARDPAPDVRALLHARRSPTSGLLDVQEPFARALHPGDDHRATARRCPSRAATSSRPATFVERYGADTARCYILFIGPPDQDADWSDDGVEGVHRFLGAAVAPRPPTIAEGRRTSRPPDDPEGADLELLRKAHWAIDKVTRDMAAASRSTRRSRRSWSWSTSATACASAAAPARCASPPRPPRR